MPKPFEYTAPGITISAQNIDGLIEGLQNNLHLHELSTLKFLFDRIAPLALHMHEEIKSRESEHHD